MSMNHVGGTIARPDSPKNCGKRQVVDGREGRDPSRPSYGAEAIANIQGSAKAGAGKGRMARKPRAEAVG